MNTNNVTTSLTSVSSQLQSDLSAAISAAAQQFGTIFAQALQQQLQQVSATANTAVQATSSTTTTQAATGGVSLADLIANALKQQGTTTTTGATQVDLTKYSTADNPLPVPDAIAGQLTYTNKEGVTWYRDGLGVDGVFKYTNSIGQSVYVTPDGSDGYKTLPASLYQGNAYNAKVLPNKIISDAGVKSVKVVDTNGYTSYQPDPSVYGKFIGAYNPYNFQPHAGETDAQIKTELANNEYARKQYDKIWGTTTAVSAVNQEWNKKYGITTA